MYKTSVLRQSRSSRQAAANSVGQRGRGTLLPLGEINIARVVETCLPFTELPWKSGKTHSNNMLGHKSRDTVRGKNVCLGFLHGKDPPQNLVRSSWHASFPSPFLRAPH